MAPLGALTQAWTSAEASMPLGWQLSGLYRFDQLWVSLAEGPEFDDYLSGSGLYAEQALRRLTDRLREQRGRRADRRVGRTDAEEHQRTAHAGDPPRG